MEDIAKDKLTIAAGTDLVASGGLKEKFPNATFQGLSEGILIVQSVQNGKIDTLILGESYLKAYMRELNATDLRVIDEPVLVYDVSLALNEKCAIPNFQAKVDATLDAMKADGTLEDIRRRWVDEGQDTPPMVKMPENPDYVLKAVTFMSRPYTFVINDTLMGRDIELAMEVASRNNWGIDGETADYTALLMGVSTGKYDMFSAHLYETAERSEGIVFSTPFYQDPIKALVRTNTGKGNQKEKTNLLETFLSSFNKNFLQENRWKSLLKGYGVTLLITVLSFLLANIMGAIFCYLGMSKRRINRALATGYSHLMQGLPILVILFILYYVIFGKSRISGIWVSILGLGITSGASMAGTFQGGIETASKGQKEAAMALGITKMQAFFGIVLPQAIRSMISGYFGQLIGLLKLTSIVGYIAVVDLTKASDLIRSATYSAFFPLLSVALIYYLIIDILLWALKLVQKQLAPKKIQEKKED